MKKIVYVLTSLSHKRVFESLVDRTDLEQTIVAPKPVITNNIVPEDYSDFKISNIITYNSMNKMENIIKQINPDVYVQSSMHKIILPVRTKKVIVHHGAVGNHLIGLFKGPKSKSNTWDGFDLYCGANKQFEKWLTATINVDNKKIITNVCPQFDLLNDQSYYNSYRDKVLKKTANPNAKKVILFVGFCCKNRVDFNPHNIDYFRTAIELEKIAKKNNWLIMIKPRHSNEKMIKFLKTHKHGKQYVSEYSKILNSKYIHFITTTGHIYRYFFADIVIVNGSSTVELEACAAKKPLIIVRTERNSLHKFDPYNTVKLGAATEIKHIGNLESGIELCSKTQNTDLQKKILVAHGMTMDGKMHKRLQDCIKNI